MLALILTAVIVFAALIFNEWWWRGRTHGELSRKFVHISVGTFVAFWPYFLSWDQIRLLSLAFVLGVVISVRLNLFKAIHSVQRPTYGEVFFGAAVGALTFITSEPVIYTIALLHMSLADGLAAVVGVNWGKRTSYRVAGHMKSVVGTLTFFVISLAIFGAYTVHRDMTFAPVFIAFAALASALENIAVKGLDNLAVPVLLAALLTYVV